MTATNTPAAKPSTLTGLLASLGMDAAVSAGISWLAGVVSSHGYHISLPYLPTWLGLFAVTVFVVYMVSRTAAGFHAIKLNYAGQITTAEKLAEKAVEEEAARLLPSLLADAVKGAKL